jgi:hypothetical protein
VHLEADDLPTLQLARELDLIPRLSRFTRGLGVHADDEDDFLLR